jgi:hypothetical protein
MNNKQEKQGFNCFNCNKTISFNQEIGTKHRNHCSFCLWSKHVDFKKPGDRKSTCQTKMKPIGLTFKNEGKDKYGKIKQGEIMLIHYCLGCGQISINRIAGDDDPEMILKTFKQSEKLDSGLKRKIQENKIRLLEKKDEKEILNQLFGKTD